MIIRAIFPLLALLIVIIYSKSVKQRIYNNQWLTSGQHDFGCYTQGLSFINNTHMLESCGLYGQSYFHVLELSLEGNKTSFTEIYRSEVFPNEIFLQGSILFPKNQIIYILTWRETIVYRFNSSDYTEILPRLSWTRGQGWGMTHNQTHIFISTGSNEIFVVDEEFNVMQVLPIVNERGRNLMYINELEWVQQDEIQYIYANIYGANELVKICLQEKKVVLRFAEDKMTSDSRKYPHGNAQDVLNGIAYRKQDNIFMITGKRWPRYYISNLDQSTV